MSRNIRLKYARPPAKSTKRRGSDTSSSLNLSDEDGYSGVEDISESDEDDEDHVNAVEEEHILSRGSQKRSTGPPRPDQDIGEDADEEDDEADEDEDDADDDEEDEEGEGETASWEGILTDRENDTSDHSFGDYLDQDVAIERHVRFAGVPDSDSDSTTSETSDTEHISLFPDIFVEQNSLDPNFRREIEHDDDDDSSNSGTFWDFYNPPGIVAHDSDDDTFLPNGTESTPTATPAASQVPTAVSSPNMAEEVQELDGYETDGDTTEEDVPEPPVRKKQLRRRPSVEPSSESDTERPERTVRFRRGKPRTGTFNLDHSDQKPIAVVNPLTRKMMIFTPQKLRRLDLSPESFNMDFFGAAGMLQASPIFSNSGSLMMGAMSSSNAMFSSNTFGDFMNTQAIGPEEAFFPFNSDAVTGDDADESDTSSPFGLADGDEEEENLKIEDFIVFNQETSDDEAEGNMVWNDDAVGDIMSTPTRPRTANSSFSAISDASMDLHPLLSHFDSNSNAVGAFRRNQINQQLIFSERATQDSLAFSGPYHYGTLKGIKSNSMGTVSTPITPVRRQKRNSVTAFNSVAHLNSSPSHIASQKRKASGMLDSEHKRHRSISDLDVLQI